MNQHHYQRMDKGQKRQRIKPSDLEREERQIARNQKGQYLPAYSTELRALVVAEAIEGLRVGITPAEIGKKHGVPQSTVYSWLIVCPEAAAARSDFFGERMGKHLEAIESAQDPLQLARGREAFRAWADVAAKRDPDTFGQKQEVTHKLEVDLGERLRRAKERILPVDKPVDKLCIEGEVVREDAHNLDKADAKP